MRLKYVCDILDEKRKPIPANQRNQDADVLYDYYGASGRIDTIDGFTIDDHVMLVGEDGANLKLRNLPLVYEVTGKAWINNHAHILKPKTENCFRFVFHAIENEDINSFITGSAQPKLSQENLKNIQIPHPSYDEQCRIADFLDKKCAEIDSLTADVQKEIETLQEYRRSLITEAVTKGLDPNVEMKDSGIPWLGLVPAEWKTSKVKYVAQISTIRALTNDGYIGLENIESWTGKIIESNVDPTGDSIAFKKGDVLFGKLRPYLAKSFVADKDGCGSTEFLVMHPRQIESCYLGYVNKCKPYVDMINESTYGAKMPRANSSFIGNMAVPLPDIKTQLLISAFLDKKCAEIDSVIETKQKQLETLAEYRKSLIYEYVTGKKEVV